MKHIVKPPRSPGLVRRLAVGEPLQRRSATLRVWADPGKSDVYAALRVIAGSTKISLHASGQCYASLTSEFAASHREVIASLGGSRHQTKWTRRTHVGPRLEIPLQFVFPESELREAPKAAPHEATTTWIPAPPKNQAVVVSFGFSGQVVADSQWPGRRNGAQVSSSRPACFPVLNCRFAPRVAIRRARGQSDRSLGDARRDGVSQPGLARDQPVHRELDMVQQGRDMLFENFPQFCPQDESANKPAEEMTLVARGSNNGWRY